MAQSQTLTMQYKLLQHAIEAAHKGSFPVGCATYTTEIITAYNTRTNGNILHAEINLLLKLGKYTPDLVVTTLEPCMMCTAALIIHGIKEVVFPFYDLSGGASLYNFNSYIGRTIKFTKIAPVPELRELILKHKRGHHVLGSNQ